MVIYARHIKSDSESSLSSGDLIGSEVPNINQGSPIRCRWTMCGQWFPHLDLLAAHVTHVHAVAGRAGLFYCGWEGCSRGDRGFNARYKMLVHVRTHTNEKPHHCFQCDKSFSRAENLKIHARSHTGERPYVCPVPGCGKAYSNSSDRFKHTRTHSVDKPYVCKVPGCPKRYTDPSSLRKHVKTYRHFPGTQLQNKESENMVVENHYRQENITNNTDSTALNNRLISSNSAVVMSQTATPLPLDSKIQPAYHIEYLTTPASQPFPAWPGLLRSWYETTNVFPWSFWTPQQDQQYRRHSLECPVIEDEQDSPLDLTVQAK